MIELYYEDINKFYSLEPSDDDYITYLWQSLVKEPFNKDTYNKYDQDGKIYSKIVNDIKNNLVDKKSLCLDPKFISFLKNESREYPSTYSIESVMAENPPALTTLGFTIKFVYFANFRA